MEADSSSNELVLAQTEGRRGRKWLRCIDQWERNKRKTKKDSGKSYKMCSGKLISPKQPSVTLSCRCQNHSSSRVTTEERKHIFDEFYRLADHDSQNKYISLWAYRTQFS